MSSPTAIAAMSDLSKLAYASQLPDGEAVIRREPGDFQVDEQLGFEPSGDGPHCLVRIEKTANTTNWVARELARANGVNLRDVGYCGLKDRNAVTRQWFSLPVDGSPQVPEVAGVRLLASVRNQRKLRRGAHNANRFVLRLRHCTLTHEVLRQRCERVASNGFPNYFGPQRFGREGHNLALAESLFAGKRLKREPRGFALSAARAALFNTLVSKRVADDTWCTPIAGDRLNLDGSGSVFEFDATDADTRSRLESGDVHVTATLWGRQGSALSAAAGEFERQVVLGEWPNLLNGLEAQKLDSSLRALRCMAQDLCVSDQDGDPVLSFSLTRGSFATALLREIVGTVISD